MRPRRHFELVVLALLAGIEVLPAGAEEGEGAGAPPESELVGPPAPTKASQLENKAVPSPAETPRAAESGLIVPPIKRVMPKKPASAAASEPASAPNGKVKAAKAPVKSKRASTQASALKPSNKQP